MAAGGTSLPWHRDPRDAFSFRVDVPAAVSSIDVRFDFLSPPNAFGSGYGKTPNVTPHLLILPFNQVLLYPLGVPADAVRVRADVRIPSGWKFDCALRPERPPIEKIELPEVSLTTLVDSPLLAGEHFRTIPLGGTADATRISIAANSVPALAMSDEQIGQASRVVAQAGVLFEHGTLWKWSISGW